jgi:transcriptional regulator with XRE-family HTH domain
MGTRIGAGPRIREWRKSKNIKGYELCKIIKVSQGSLSDIENGKSDPSAKTILGFMLYTDIDFVWMMTGVKGGLGERVVPEKEPPMVITLSPSVNEVLIKRN